MATFELGKNAFFARLNPDTGEYEKIEPLKSPALIHFVPEDNAPQFESIDLSKVLASFTITVKIPYSFWWRINWKRGYCKAVNISPIPVGNPEDN